MMSRLLPGLWGRRGRILVLLVCFLALYTWNQGYVGASSTFQHDEYMLGIAPGLMYSTGSWIAKQTSAAPPAGRHDHYQTMLGPPHCFHYALIAVVHTIYLAGTLAEVYGTPFDLITDYDFVKQLGRALTVICSLGSLLMTYRIGRLVFDSERVSLAAVVLMGLSSYYVAHSRLAKVDLPMIFFATVSMYYALRAYESGGITDYLWAGLFCGLSAGTKLPGAFTVFPILATYVAGVAQGREPLVPWKLAAAGGTAFAGMFGTNPNLLVYFDDFIWALRIFSQDLRGQGGISQPTLHYYLSLDSLRLLVDRTFPQMFAGRVATYFALGGFVMMAAKRVRKGWVLASLPVCYILLNLPMLVSRLYREYHLCVFVMALMAAYGIHLGFHYTVDRFVRAKSLRLLCWCTLLILLLRAQIVYADRVVYYAGQPSSREVMFQWINRYIPEDSRFVTSALAGADSRWYRTTGWLDLARNPSWRDEIAQSFDYVSIVPYKAHALFEFCEQRASLVKIFSVPSTGHADIRLYALGEEALRRIGVASARDRIGYEGLSCQILAADGLMHFGRQTPGAQTALVLFGDVVSYVGIPEDCDAAYVRVSKEQLAQGPAMMVGVLPFEVPLGQRVVSIDRVYSDQKLLATEYGLTDGSIRRAYSESPEVLMAEGQWATATRRPVLDVPGYLRAMLRRLGEGSTEENTMNPEPTSGRIVVVERPAGKVSIQLEVESGPAVREMVRFQVESADGASSGSLPPDRVRLRVLRPDGTCSKVIFQNWPMQDAQILLPPIGLSPGDRVRLEFG